MFYLSMSDLLLLDSFVDAFAREDQRALNKVLWVNGMDISKSVEEQFNTHRNLRNKVETCIRYVGVERTDKEWLKGGAASLDAYIESSKDKSLAEELKSLNPRDNKDWSDDYACNCDIPEPVEDDCI